MGDTRLEIAPQPRFRRACRCSLRLGHLRCSEIRSDCYHRCYHGHTSPGAMRPPGRFRGPHDGRTLGRTGAAGIRQGDARRQPRGPGAPIVRVARGRLLRPPLLLGRDRSTRGCRRARAGSQVRPRRPFLSADRRRTYCLYEAPSASAITAAAERDGVPADQIVVVP